MVTQKVTVNNSWPLTYIAQKSLNIALIPKIQLSNWIKIQIPNYAILRSNYLNGNLHEGAALKIRSTIFFYNTSQIREPHTQSFTFQITLYHSLPSLYLLFIALLTNYYSNAIWTLFQLSLQSFYHGKWPQRQIHTVGISFKFSKKSLKQVITSKNCTNISSQNSTY